MTVDTCAGLKEQRFGGSWTEVKIEMIRKYLDAYTIALQYRPYPENPYKLIYIDAFAGTGHYNNKDNEDKDFKMDGSAKVALELKRPFSTYYFIDNDSDKLEQLQELILDYTHLGSNFILKNGDANPVICEICKEVDWRNQRAVMFLDPFGLQVSWDTIRTIAATKSIDLWFLFPIFAINRMLKKNGQISDEWSAKLDDVLGSHDWYNEFYTESRQMTLLPLPKEYKKTTTFDKIISYIVRKLEVEFAAVHKKPRVFKSSKNSPLFAFCFAIGNESKATKTLALKIAGHILED